MARPGRPWTKSEKTLLKTLYVKENKIAREIALVLHRSVMSIRMKVFSEGLMKISELPWTEKQVAAAAQRAQYKRTKLPANDLTTIKGVI